MWYLDFWAGGDRWHPNPSFARTVWVTATVSVGLALSLLGWPVGLESSHPVPAPEVAEEGLSRTPRQRGGVWVPEMSSRLPTASPLPSGPARVSVQVTLDPGPGRAPDGCPTSRSAAAETAARSPSSRGHGRCRRTASARCRGGRWGEAAVSLRPRSISSQE